MRITATLAGLAALALAGPAVSLADTGTSGNLQLKLDVAVEPAKAGTKAALRGVSFRYSQTLTTKDGTRPTADVRRITLTSPGGFRVNTAAFPQCKLSTVPDHGVACPKDTEVGFGTATADARPLLPNLIGAEVLGYAGIDDLDLHGNPQTPKPALLVTADARVAGVTVSALFPADIKANKLVVDLPAGSGGGAQQPYIIRTLKLALRNLTGKGGVPLVQASTRCSGTWTFKQTTAFSDGTSVTAKDTVPCKAAS
jgi:hypothetical protein